MKAKELREKDMDGLRQELQGRRREQFNLRMQQGSGQATRPHHIKAARRDIARIKTVMAEKQRVGKGS